MCANLFRGQSFLVLFPILLASVPLLGQTTARLEGRVQDPSQASIPNVPVKATNEATKVVFSTKTNADGLFLFDNLPIGRYDLAVSQPGFKGYTASGIVLDLTARVRRDVTLEVGDVQQNVTVSDTAAGVQLAEGTVSSVITTEQISAAVLNGRNFTRLAAQLPGAVYQSGSDEL